jgi:hypothetical protein
MLIIAEIFLIMGINFRKIGMILNIVIFLLIIIVLIDTIHNNYKNKHSILNIIHSKYRNSKYSKKNILSILSSSIDENGSPFEKSSIEKNIPILSDNINNEFMEFSESSSSSETSEENMSEASEII